MLLKVVLLLVVVANEGTVLIILYKHLGDKNGERSCKHFIN